jgi:NADH dehydrogenase
MTTQHRPRAVIVGAGFGGLWAARSLVHSPVEVLLIDRHNYHCFLPLLYQVAAAELEPEEIAYPVRSILWKLPNVRFVLADVKTVDLSQRVLETDGPAISYDFLILATGSVSHFFGVPGASEYTFPLKTLEQGVALRTRILCCFERAALEPDPERRRRLLTFAIMGGGPTGVELAGALGEISNNTLRHDFRHINPAEAQILLVEGEPRVLPLFPPDLSAKAERQLLALGVRSKTNARVTNIQEGSVTLLCGGQCGGREEQIATHTVLWAAGVRASELGKVLADRAGAPLDRAGRVIVEPDLTVPGHAEIHVIGDLASFSHQTGKPLPGVAPVAMQQGRYVAHAIRNKLAGKTNGPFHYFNKGNLATIGRNKAVAEFGKLHVAGFAAWFLWVFVHLMYLVEFENRMLVFVQWVYDYFTRNRGARLITK